jgi:hypothetical protein
MYRCNFGKIMAIEIPKFDYISLMIHGVTKDCSEEGDRLIIAVNLLMQKANSTIYFCLCWTIGSLLP